MKKVFVIGGIVLIFAIAAGVLMNQNGKVNPDDIPWGPEQDGIRVRLVPLSGGFRVGKPMPFSLEMKNVSEGIIEYDSQGIGLNDSFLVKDASGTEVPYVGGSAQTVGGGRPLDPGQTVTLANHVDMAAEYLFPQRGVYQIQMRPRGPAFGSVSFPASNVVEVKVGRGKLSAAQSVAAKLSPILPDKTWEVGVSGTDHVYLTCNRTGLKADIYSISLQLEKTKLEGDRAEEFEFLGSKSGRFFYWSETPVEKVIDEVWMDHRQSILGAIGIKKT